MNRVPSSVRAKWVSHIGETGAALALTDSSMVKDAFVCVIRCKYSNYFWNLG